MSRYSIAVSGVLLLSPLFGCHVEEGSLELRHELNGKALAASPDLEANRVAKEQLHGALEMLFGTPGQPGYLLLQDWIDDEYDPNDGSLELSDEEWEALQLDNERAFRQQLAAIEEARFDRLLRPLYAADLWASWTAHLEEMPEGGPDAVLYDDDPEWTWRDEAKSIFVSWYPTLPESARMYRIQCMHCHGVSGGGDGSTSEFLNPRPRDYRQGKFKFTALKDKARPRRADLMRILEEGIYTTAMPSFGRFSNAQLNGLVDYVRLLSRRGETEEILVADFDPDFGFSAEGVLEQYSFVHDRWLNLEEKLVTIDGGVPAATVERIAHGRELFMGAEGSGANCASCHGITARGDGASAKERDPESGEMVWAKDDWGNDIKPRNLKLGVFRFGRRPIDIYRRMYSGINGTPMPEHIGMQITEADGTKRPLDENDLWDLVHFVRSLSEHEMVVTPEPAAHQQAPKH